MANKIVKKVPTQAEGATATAEVPAPKTNIADAAKAAVASRASEVKSPRGQARTHVSRAWDQPPKTAHNPKGVPASAVTLAVQRAAKDGPGLYVVELENKRGHHVLIAVKDDQVATHGGCVQAVRAVSYAKLHSGIYEIPINASLASKDVQNLLKSE